MLGATILWAFAGPVIKLGLASIPPFTFLMYRHLLVCLIITPFMFFELRKHKIDKKDYINILLLGLFGQTSLAVIFVALRYTTVIDVSIIGLLSPILVVWAGYHFFNEKVTKLEKIGLFIATIGALFVTVGPAIAGSNGHGLGERLFGNVLYLTYLATWPVYIILGKRMMGQRSKQVNKAFHYFHLEQMHKKYDPVILTSLTFYVGLITMIPLSIWEVMQTNISYTLLFDTTAILSVIYMAVFSSIAAYFLFQWGIKFIEATESALFSYISPLFAIPAAMILLGESISSTALYGLIIITIGVVIAEKYKN